MVADSRSSPDRVALPVRDNNRTAMEVQVVDKAGTPLRGVTVTEHWSHSSLEHNGHEAEATTDEGGYVTFPVRGASSRIPLISHKTLDVLFPRMLVSDQGAWRSTPGQGQGP